MELQYEVTIDDVVAFQRHFAEHSPTARRLRRRAILWCGLGAAIVLYALGYREPLPFLIAIGFVVGSYALWFRFGHRWHVGRLVRRLLAEGRNRMLVTRHKLCITSDALVDSTQAGEARASWEAVERVEEGQAHIFLFTAATMAHIVPKRAFSSESEVTQFLSLVGQYRASTGV